MQQQRQNTQYLLDDIQQENLPLELYLNGNEDLSDLQISDFNAESDQMNRKRRRIEPIEQIKCEEVYVMASQLNNNQCLVSSSSTNSSNNENAWFVFLLVRRFFLLVHNLLL